MSTASPSSPPSSSSLDAAFAALDARVDARIDELVRRASASEEGDDGDVSFGLGAGEAEPDDELWALVRLARGEIDDDEELSFAVGDVGEEGRLDRARRELSELVDRVMESLTSLAVVDTSHGSSRAKTRVGWTGDVTTFVAPGTSPEVVRAHAATVEASLNRSMLRLRLFTSITAAAGRLAAVLTTPASAVMALPIAYRCVRDVYEQLSSLRELSKTGETPWQ